MSTPQNTPQEKRKSISQNSLRQIGKKFFCFGAQQNPQSDVARRQQSES
jgi:hypothetical protein